MAQVTLEHIREAAVEAGLFARSPQTIMSLPRIIQV
jgi:hypothetical protein